MREIVSFSKFSVPSSRVFTGEIFPTGRFAKRETAEEASSLLYVGLLAGFDDRLSFSLGRQEPYTSLDRGCR